MTYQRNETPEPLATINASEFRELTLRSADEDGKVTPPPYGDWWTQQSILIGMYMKGLIEKRGEGRMYDRGGPWYITATGQEATNG
jgi:hypothetical protein